MFFWYHHFFVHWFLFALRKQVSCDIPFHSLNDVISNWLNLPSSTLHRPLAGRGSDRIFVINLVPELQNNGENWSAMYIYMGAYPRKVSIDTYCICTQTYIYMYIYIYRWSKYLFYILWIYYMCISYSIHILYSVCIVCGFYFSGNITGLWFWSIWFSFKRAPWPSGKWWSDKMKLGSSKMMVEFPCQILAEKYRKKSPKKNAGIK